MGFYGDAGRWNLADDIVGGEKMLRGFWERITGTLSRITNSTGFRRVTALALTAALTALDSKTQFLDATTKAELVGIVITAVWADTNRPFGTPAVK